MEIASFWCGLLGMHSSTGGTGGESSLFGRGGRFMARAEQKKGGRPKRLGMWEPREGSHRRREHAGSRPERALGGLE